jgi:hypothetical protein
MAVPQPSQLRLSSEDARVGCDRRSSRGSRPALSETTSDATSHGNTHLAERLEAERPETVANSPDSPSSALALSTNYWPIHEIHSVTRHRPKSVEQRMSDLARRCPTGFPSLNHSLPGPTTPFLTHSTQIVWLEKLLLGRGWQHWRCSMSL